MLVIINAVMFILHFCCCSVTKSWLILSDPMDFSMPGFPVLHYLPEFAQIHVHWVSDAILSSSPFAFSLSQHQVLFWWVGSSHHLSKVLELQLQHQPSNEPSGLTSFRIDWFDLFAGQKDSQVFSSTTTWKLQFFCIRSSLWTDSHICTWLLEIP